MQTINLKQYYPFCKEDIFVEVSDEIVEAFLLDKRAEAARDRKMFRYYNGGTAAIWQTAGKLFQKKNAMNHLFIAFLIPYSIFSLVVRPCVQQRLRGCCEDFDFSVRQLIQQRFKLHPLRGLALHSFTMKNLIHRDMIAGHQF